MSLIGRRAFLRDSVYLAFLQQAARMSPAATSAQREEGVRALAPKIDTHIHLYDPTRPGGVPWPLASDVVLYRPALPNRYRLLARPFGIVGAIAIECSPLASDNDWLLRIAASNDFIVGVIGDLDPSLTTFSFELQRLRADPHFLGIRYGNLWNRSLGAHLKDTAFVENLKMLAKSGLVLESANPNPTLIAELALLTSIVPDLRIVIDHLPQAPPSDRIDVRDRYLEDLRVIRRQSNVFVKGSEILRRIDGKVSMDVEFYRPWLDQIWEIFGEDRMLFGSDWPNSDTTAPFADTLSIAQRYILTRSRGASQRYWWKNSEAAYGWKPRNAAQTELLHTHVD